MGTGGQDGDQPRRGKRRPSNQVRNTPYLAGAYPEELLDPLYGDWNFPIMSRKEHIRTWEKVSERCQWQLLLMMGFSVIFVLVDYALVFTYPRYCTGILVLLSIPGGLLIGSSVFVYASEVNLQRVQEKDQVYTSSVPFKPHDRQRDITAVEEFLIANGEPFSTKLDREKFIGARYRNYKLEDGVEVRLVHYKDSNVGQVSIDYGDRNYLHARKVQRKMDTFFTDQDLLKLADWKFEEI